MSLQIKFITLLLSLSTAGLAQAETLRIAIGTQDTTINCATGGLLIRELKLLEKYLPRDGKYRDVQYDIQWRNFTSGAPLTNEMLAGKLDLGSMADFPGAFNVEAFRKAGRKSLFINVLSGSTTGSGNGIVVPKDSPVQSLQQLKAKTISVPFASTAHGMLLRAVAQLGWNPEADLNIIAQVPEIAGAALQTNKVDAHADFVPFAELFPYRGYAKKIYDGSQSNTPTFHGTLADAAFAEKYPEIVIAFLRAAIDAADLLSTEPEKYSELIAENTGVEAEVVYLFHGPLGVQTRDFTWKPEYRQAVKTAFETLKFLKRSSSDLDADQFIDDRYIRAAYKQSGIDYDASLKQYRQSPLSANDAGTGKAITDFKKAVQVWVAGEARVRHYATAESAFAGLNALKKAGKQIRIVYVQDNNSGIKLPAADAWYVQNQKDGVSAFLLKDQAEDWANKHGGSVLDFVAINQALAG